MFCIYFFHHTNTHKSEIKILFMVELNGDGCVVAMLYCFLQNEPEMASLSLPLFYYL